MIIAILVPKLVNYSYLYHWKIDTKPYILLSSVFRQLEYQKQIKTTLDNNLQGLFLLCQRSVLFVTLVVPCVSGPQFNREHGNLYHTQII